MRIARYMTDLITLCLLTVIALFLFALYQEPEMINAVYCELNTESTISYTACRIANY